MKPEANVLFLCDVVNFSLLACLFLSLFYAAS